MNAEMRQLLEDDCNYTLLPEVKGEPFELFKRLRNGAIIYIKQGDNENELTLRINLFPQVSVGGTSVMIRLAEGSVTKEQIVWPVIYAVEQTVNLLKLG